MVERKPPPNFIEFMNNWHPNCSKSGPLLPKEDMHPKKKKKPIPNDPDDKKFTTQEKDQ